MTKRPVSDPTPRRFVKEHGRHLREPKDEDEVKEQFEWRDSSLALRLLTHDRTLPFDCTFAIAALQLGEWARTVNESGTWGRPSGVTKYPDAVFSSQGNC